MKNIILMKQSKELEELSKSLGFTKTLFIEKDVIFIFEDNKREIQRISGNSSPIKVNNKKTALKKIKEAKKKSLFVIFEPNSEEMMRFVLEKTAIDMIIGMEKINPKESVHFTRCGLDQITCKIANDKEKIVGFSFSDILNSKNRARTIRRMMFNIKLCQKYNVKMFFGNFSRDKEELRSTEDLAACLRILGENKFLNF